MKLNYCHSIYHIFTFCRYYETCKNKKVVKAVYIHRAGIRDFKFPKVQNRQSDCDGAMVLILNRGNICPAGPCVYVIPIVQHMANKVYK